MAFNKEALTPEFFLSLGSGLLSGGTWNQQLANASTNVAGTMAAQKEKAKTDLQLKTTADWLQDKDPELSMMVRNGTFAPADAYKTYLTRQDAANKAKQPDYNFMNVDGKIVRTDKTSGNFQEMADYSKPKLPAIAEEYNWAKDQGFTGTPQEYQVWKANLAKQKGMTVEYDPVNGFRMTQGEVDGNKMPKLTEAEGKNAGFLKRALSAEKELSALEDEGTSLWNKTAGNIPVVGNYMVSADAQKFSQAQRNFINAVLRRESGAVISPDEFENARQQYFPQPGDSGEVIAQKRQNRQDAIAGFEISSGPAADKVRIMDQQSQPNPNTGVVDYKDYFK